MSAARFIGRVGGLAAALGAGMVLFGGAGVAWADSGTDTTSATSAGSARGSEHRAASTGDRRGAAPARSGRVTTAAPAASASTSVSAETVRPAAAATPRASIRSALPAAAAQPAAPQTPSTPAANVAQLGLAAAARRQAAATPATVTEKGITFDTSVTLVDGVIQGDLQTTSSSGALGFTYELIGGGSNGGKISLGTVPGAGNAGYTVLPYASWLEPGGSKGTEQFQIRIRELTLTDALLLSLPVVGQVALQAVRVLQEVPLLNDLLAPIIGSSVVATIDVDVDALAPGETPLAMTYKVTSFDGVKISTNFFPAVGLAAGQTAATTIVAPGFGGPGATDPYAMFALKNEVPGVGMLREAGYNVVSFDPRGEFQSGGVMRMASPDYEGRDDAALVDWIADATPAELNGPGDPKVGMVGGSYGGALQLAAAGNPEIDAMIPVDSWDALLSTFYPAETFKSAYGALYLINLLLSGVRADPQLYLAVATGLGFDWLGPWSQEFMNASNPRLDEQSTATLSLRGIQDVLVPLDQGDRIAETILNNGLGTPVKTLWFDGGHGAVGLSPDDQSAIMIDSTMAWLDSYVRGNSAAAESLPNFQWFDQHGDYQSSAFQPFEAGFNDLPAVTATAAGGLLGILPIIGGSGPGVGDFPINLVNAGPAANAINVAVPTAALQPGTQVVGSPTVSFTYRGLGTAGAVFAQVIDNATGTVLGNVVTPVPVVLDGQERTVSVDISDIAYTVGAGDSLTVQITSSATAFANAAFGLINISDLTVTLPNRTA